MKLLAAALLLAVLLLVTGQSPAHSKPNTRHNRQHAIVHAFCHSLKPCSLGYKALDVAYCESGANLWPWATNGQYWGMLQVSGHWRASVPGWAWNPWAQARHGYRVWRLVGWSHWECA